MRGGRRWRWLSCGPPCLDLGPVLGWAIIKWVGVMHPTSIFAQTPRLVPCPLASRPRHTAQAAGRLTNPPHDAKKARMKETRLGEKCRGDSHAEGGGACPRPTEKNTTPARRRAPAALGCHDPATPNAQAATPPSQSHVARVVAMDPCPRCVVWGRGVVLFFCAALNKRPSLCGVSWWSAGFAQGGASANLVW